MKSMCRDEEMPIALSDPTNLIEIPHSHSTVSPSRQPCLPHCRRGHTAQDPHCLTVVNLNEIIFPGIRMIPSQGNALTEGILGGGVDQLELPDIPHRF